MPETKKIRKSTKVPLKKNKNYFLGRKKIRNFRPPKAADFFLHVFSWVVAPIFDGLDVGIQKMSKKKFCTSDENVKKTQNLT